MSAAALLLEVEGHNVSHLAQPEPAPLQDWINKTCWHPRVFLPNAKAKRVHQNAKGFCMFVSGIMQSGDVALSMVICSKGS